MKLKFIGQYTGGRTSIEMGDYVFEGHEPTEVDGRTAAGKKLAGNPDFEVVGPLDHDGDGEKGGSLKGEKATAKQRVRKPKKAPAK
jgi:hypothetical protein